MGRVRIDRQYVPGSVASQEVDSYAHNSSRLQYLTWENVIVHYSPLANLALDKFPGCDKNLPNSDIRSRFLFAWNETNFRQADTNDRWSLKPLCLAAQSGETRMFIHDFESRRDLNICDLRKKSEGLLERE